jgi:hypothetical protein
MRSSKRCNSLPSPHPDSCVEESNKECFSQSTPLLYGEGLALFRNAAYARYNQHDPQLSVALADCLLRVE